MHSIEGVDMAGFDCVYSPAKRRGPVPGRGGMKNVSRTTAPGVYYNQQQHHPQAMQQQQNFGNNLNGGIFGMGLNGMGGQQQQQGQNLALSADQLKQMLQLQQSLLVQQQQMQQQQGLNLQQPQQQQGLMQQVAGVIQGQGQGATGGNVNFAAAGGIPTSTGVDLSNLYISNLGNTNTGIDMNLLQNLQMPQQQIPNNQGDRFSMNQMPNQNQIQQLLNNQVNNMNQQTINDQVNQLNQQMLANSLSMNQPIRNGQNQMNQQMPPTIIQIPNGQNQINRQMPPTDIQIQMNKMIPSNNQNQANQMPVNESMNQSNDYNMDDNRSAKRIARQTSKGMNVPNSIASFLPLLQLNNPEGTVLRSYYQLSTNDVLSLPPIPTDDEYCTQLAAQPNSNYDLSQPIPTYDQSALNAARFSELSLGALANNQTSLALELSNASVMCLRNCVEEPSNASCMYDVARAYLLHGIFRSKRGDMVRYFKYRRVCMAHISAMKVSNS